MHGELIRVVPRNEHSRARHRPLPPFMTPLLFIPVFVAFWAAITALLAFAGGWATLAEQFPAAHSSGGERFRSVSGSIRGKGIPVNYRSCLTVTVDEAGFLLSIFFPFRLFSPPLFVPWSAVAAVETKRILFGRTTRFRLRDIGTVLSIQGRAGDAMRLAHDHAKGLRAPVAK